MSADPIARLLTTVLERSGSRPAGVLALDLGSTLLALPQTVRASCVAVAPWRPDFDALAGAGIDVVPSLSADTAAFDLVLLRLGRQRRRNLARIAEAVRHTATEGRVIVAGENQLGAASYAKLLPAATSHSGQHARALVLARREAPPAELLSSWEADAAPRRDLEGGHVTAPGLFAWDRVDAGSKLLATSLPADLAGDVADLGAGWGYLAMTIVARCPAIRCIDLYEADWMALEAARANLRDPRAGFHWHDVTRPLVRGGYDAIVTNPPFHATRRADPEIGRRVIRMAQAALRPQGELWLVANRHLPYEQTLRGGFSEVELRDEADGFKVLRARRPNAQNVPG